MLYTALFGNKLADAEAGPFETNLDRLELSSAEVDALYQQVRRLTVDYAHTYTERIPKK